MTHSAQDIARALVELSRSMPEGDSFLRQVQRELSKYVKGDITSATLITPDGKAGPLVEDVKKMLEQRLGHSVEIVEQADPSLLGGAVIHYGDQQIDLSLKGSLNQLESSIRTSSKS